MNNTTIAHIGGELVVLSGISFLFYKKTNSLKKDLDLVTEKNKELTEVVNSLQEHIQRLSMAVMQLQESHFQQPKPMRVPQQPPKPVVVQPPKPSVIQKPKIEVESDSEDSGDETLDDSVLDKELESELSKLNCDGDTCKLVD